MATQTSAIIMGGSIPASHLSRMADQLGAIPGGDRGDGFCGYVFTRQGIEQNIGALIALAEGVPDRAVAFQVVGALVLRYGAAVDPSCLFRIVSEAADDDGARQPGSDREFYVCDLIDKIGRHRPGHCTDLATQREP